MKTMKIYKNYGCLAREKRCVYTYGAEQPTAVTSEEATVEIPDGWEVSENTYGEIFLTAPWGTLYLPNEVLGGDEYPHFMAYDKDGKFHSIKLKEVE